MTDWQIKGSDLKGYPHFDAVISTAEATRYASDPKKVIAHTFYPFMLYEERWNKFAEKGQKGKQKSRPIRYGARRDAYIYTRYRHILSEAYEAALLTKSLEHNVLAYRRIPTPDGRGGKCNIHFAKDAFDAARQLENCAAVAIDISGFFESLDHELLKEAWQNLLAVSRLPDDHFAVFTAITAYAYVDRLSVYERLGHYGPKRKSKNGKDIKGYLTPYKDVPKQLCTGRQFRDKIAGGPTGSIVKKNYKKYGIPQGSPMSDVLANIYMMDFDLEIKSAVEAAGGVYFRYSDDVLIIAPGGEAEAHAWIAACQSAISKYGSKLKIKEEKAVAHALSVSPDGGLDCARVHGTQGANGLEYLGFRFDGKRVYLRDTTLSNLYRKVAMAARRDANRDARRYPDRSAEQLKASFDYNRLIARFGRVEDFAENSKDYTKWTFWTYAQKAAEVFGSEGNHILGQLRSHRTRIKARANLEIDRAVAGRTKRLLEKAKANSSSSLAS